MARLAATELRRGLGPQRGRGRVLAGRAAATSEGAARRPIPERFGVVRGAWRNFVPRPDDDRLLRRADDRAALRAERSIRTRSAPTSSPRTARVPDVRIGRGNHEAFADGLVALRGWYPIEILHFPVRSLEHCRRKYVTQFVALERNAEKGIPGHMAEAYDAYRAGRLDAFYAPLVVDDEALEAGLADGTYAIDTRLRDALRVARVRRRQTASPSREPAAQLGGRGRGALRRRVLGARRGRPRRLLRRADRRAGSAARPARAGPRRSRAPRLVGSTRRERAWSGSWPSSRRGGRRSSSSRSRSASSGSRRSAGRWRRGGTRGTTSSTTSSSSTPSRRSRRCSSSALRSRRSSSGFRWTSAGASCSRSSSACSSPCRSSRGARRR